MLLHSFMIAMLPLSLPDGPCRSVGLENPGELVQVRLFLPRRPFLSLVVVIPTLLALVRSSMAFRSNFKYHIEWKMYHKLLVVLLLSLVVCQWIPDSLFYLQNSAHQRLLKLKKENTNRITFYRNYLHHTRKQVNSTGQIGRVSIYVVSTSRERHFINDYEPHYLLQVVSELLLQLSETYAGFGRRNPVVCNVDGDARSHKDAGVLSAYVPVVARFNKTTLSLEESKLQKENLDYAWCLEQSLLLANNEEFILLFEDDALPIPGFIKSLDDILFDLDTLFIRGEPMQRPTNSKPAWVKFFRPRALAHWWSHQAFAFQLVLLATIMAALLSSTGFCVKVTMAFFYSVFVLIIVGRPNLLQLLPVHRSSYTDCCTPAVLFARGHLPALVSFLRTQKAIPGRAKDSLMGEFLSLNNLSAWSYEPNLLKHIGLYSSLRSAIIDPLLI